MGGKSSLTGKILEERSHTASFLHQLSSLWSYPHLQQPGPKENCKALLQCQVCVNISEISNQRISHDFWKGERFFINADNVAY